MHANTQTSRFRAYAGLFFFIVTEFGIFPSTKHLEVSAGAPLG